VVIYSCLLIALAILSLVVVVILIVLNGAWTIFAMASKWAETEILSGLIYLEIVLFARHVVRGKSGFLH